jgi:uncharacterized protein YcfL
MNAQHLLCLGILGLAACSSPGVRNGDLSGIGRYVGDDDIEDVIELERERIAYSRNDLAVFQVDLVNQDDKDRRVEYRARWFDPDGIEVLDAARSWRPVFVPGRSSTPVRSTAPNMEAVRCEIEVRLHRPSGF